MFACFGQQLLVEEAWYIGDTRSEEIRQCRLRTADICATAVAPSCHDCDFDGKEGGGDARTLHQAAVLCWCCNVSKKKQGLGGRKIEECGKRSDKMLG